MAVATTGCVALQSAVLVTPEGTFEHTPTHGRGIDLGDGDSGINGKLVPAPFFGLFADAVVYCSDQTHSAVERALRVLGFAREQLCKLPSDEAYRLPLAALQSAVAADRANGHRPFCVIANAGTTNTGAIDPLPELVEFCRAQDLWLHVDGAHGAAAMLCERGQVLLKGLSEVDSLALDPHKWLFQTYEIGCVLVRDVRWLKQTFHVLPEYLEDTQLNMAEVNFYERGYQLTRSFRALKIWLSFKAFGVAAFRAAVAHGLELAEFAERELRADACWQVVSPATLGIVAFRFAPAGVTGSALDELNQQLVTAVREDGFAFASSTVTAVPSPPAMKHFLAAFFLACDAWAAWRCFSASISCRRRRTSRSRCASIIRTSATTAT